MSAPVPPPPGPGVPPPTGTSGYPVSFTFNSPGKIARWRPLVHWLLAIPHFILLYVLSIVAFVLIVVAWFAGVFAGKVPAGVQGLLVATIRYSFRVQTYLLFLREEYPPFALDTEFSDPGTDPRTRFDVVPAIEGRSRLTIFFRGLMIIPHYIELIFLLIAFYVVIVIGWFAVIILGRWPAGLESFVVGFIRWNARFSAYFYLLTDDYPPFGFE